MANFYLLFKNSAGGSENLRPSDGGAILGVIDSEAAGSVVDLFPSVTSAGSVALFSNYDGTAGVGALGSTFAFQGSVTVATNVTVTGNSVFNGDVDLGLNSTKTISFIGSVDSNIAFENSGPRSITLDGQTLTVGVTTAGKLQLDGASEVEINTVLVDANATGGIQLDAVTTSQFVVSGAAADLTLGARAGTVTLNEAAHTGLDASFTATSIIGALNEVKTTNLGTTTPSVVASEVIVAGQAVYVDWDVGNGRPGLYLADNTVAGKKEPIGVSLNGGGIGTTIYIAGPGQEAVINTLIAANTEGALVYLDTAGNFTVTPPAAPPLSAGDTSQIVGVATVAGAAGSAKMYVLLRPPKTL